MPKYPIQTPVKHGKKIHSTGDIELTEAQAEPLLACGAIGPAHKAAPAAPKKKATVKKKASVKKKAVPAQPAG